LSRTATTSGKAPEKVKNPRPRLPEPRGPDSNDSSSGGSAATEVVARFGSFLLTRGGDFDGPISGILDKVIVALEKDARVRKVQRPRGLEEDWCLQRIIYPASQRDDEDLVLRSDHLHALRFSEPLLFDVEVPEKNQRLVAEGESIPTHYRAAWDGWLAVVTWEQPLKDAPLPLSGGHVVKDVLEDALERCGEGLFVQACNPACSYDFAHTSIRAKATGSAEITYAPGEYFAEVEASMPNVPVESWAEVLLLDIRLSSEEFLEIKNLGRRILDLERDARRTLSMLTALNYQRALIPTRELLRRPKDRWEMRGWRKESRKLISRLWLALSGIEQFRRRWAAAYFHFEESIEASGRSHLFARDYAYEVDEVRSLDLDLLRSGAQEAAERLDYRALSSATALAGVVGAITGGIVAAIVGGAGPG
jgi:hypothetical protein